MLTCIRVPTKKKQFELNLSNDLRLTEEKLNITNYLEPTGPTSRSSVVVVTPPPANRALAPVEGVKGYIS